MKSAASNSPARPRPAARGDARPPLAARGDARRRGAGDTLVECLVALAFAGIVFLPASAALRASVRREADTAARLAAAASLRPRALAAAAALRAGADAPGDTAALRVRDAAFAAELPSGLPLPRVVLAGASSAPSVLLPFPPPAPPAPDTPVPAP